MDLNQIEQTPVSERYISDEQLQLHLYELSIFGFTVVPKLVFPEEAAVLRDALGSAVNTERDLYKDNPYWNDSVINNLVAHGDNFYWLLDHGIMHQLFNSTLDHRCILYAYSSTYLEPDSIVNANEPHVDSNRFIKSYNTGISMLLALSAFTSISGAPWFLPGSHISAEQPDQQTFERYAVQLMPNIGDALFFNPRTYHRADINTSDEVRYGLSTYAVRSFMRQRYDYPRLIPHEDLKQLSDRTLRFLGFNVRVPVSVDEFYCPPSERLYLADQG